MLGFFVVAHSRFGLVFSFPQKNLLDWRRAGVGITNFSRTSTLIMARKRAAVWSILLKPEEGRPKKIGSASY
jgi:hypothetical protein